MKKNILIITASLLSTQAFAIQEIPDTTINNFAVASVENETTVIRYNPESCDALGDSMCKFFLSREYGHIALEHPLGSNYTEEEENEADCWVTQNAPENLTQSAYEYFSNNSHNEAIQRAERLSECPKAPVFEKPSISEISGKRIQAKSNFNHYKADRVFRDIENKYSFYFPYSGTYGWEYITSYGAITYDKKYYNGSALSEERGGLYYKLFGGNWNYWGPISHWVL